METADDKGILRKYDHFLLRVAERQHTLGCCEIVVLRSDAFQLHELGHVELSELALVQKHVVVALRTAGAFKPDIIHHAEFGDGTTRFMRLILPRYREARNFPPREWRDALPDRPLSAWMGWPEEPSVIQAIAERLRPGLPAWAPRGRRRGLIDIY